jgi:hypothetical protein
VRLGGEVDETVGAFCERVEDGPAVADVAADEVLARGV